jgi:8-oxo-dGTP pyrophosphatase MutT (NUDIX family)
VLSSPRAFVGGSAAGMISAASLLEDLERFRPADSREVASLERIRALLSSAADPFSRDFIDHITGSAVIARPEGDGFLLVFHRRLERWLQPGGHVEDRDASVFETARREAREETGVAALDAPLGPLVLDVDVHPIPPRADRPAHVHFDLRYLLTTSQESFVAQAEEVRGVAWFTLAEAVAAGADASLERALAKARSALSPPSPGGDGV